MQQAGHSGEVIIEFIHQGKFVKVSAIDIKTQEEVSIVGDPKQEKRMLQQLAIQKLRYVQSKR